MSDSLHAPCSSCQDHIQPSNQRRPAQCIKTLGHGARHVPVSCKKRCFLSRFNSVLLFVEATPQYKNRSPTHRRDVARRNKSPLKIHRSASSNQHTPQLRQNIQHTAWFHTDNHRAPRHHPRSRNAQGHISTGRMRKNRFLRFADETPATQESSV